jgi:hypothetical protein
MVLAETSRLRARRWCSLGPLWTRADSAVHHTMQEPVQHAMPCKSKSRRGGRMRGGEKEGRGSGGTGEGSRSDCGWQGIRRGLGDRRMRRKGACCGGADVMEMERSCAVARGKDINIGSLWPFGRQRGVGFPVKCAFLPKQRPFKSNAGKCPNPAHEFSLARDGCPGGC